MDIGDDESQVFPTYLSRISLPPLLEVCDRLLLLRCRKVGGVATMREGGTRQTNDPRLQNETLMATADETPRILASNPPSESMDQQICERHSNSE